MALKKSKSGLEILGDITWGSHFCLFYELKEDLLEVLIPYFKVGLENNEYCMWVTSEPLTAKDAENAMRNALPNFDLYLKKKQIEIIPYTDWYLKNNEFDSQTVLKGWVDKLDSVLNNGFDGLRLTGNTFWLEKKDWKSFADYEAEVNNVIGNYHMIGICTYSLEKCGPYEIIDVIRNHQFALIRREGKWDYFKSMEQTQLEQKLKESEESYRLITENANDLIAILNQNFELEYINEDIHKNLMGYTKDEAIGNSIVDIIHPDDIKKATEIIKKVFKIGEGSGEVRIRHKDGSWKWIESKLKAFLDSNNEKKIIIISRDITERKKAEQKLIESEEKFRSLVETTSDWIWEVDQNGVYTYCSPKVIDILGYRPQEVIGKTPFELMPFDEAESVNRIYQSIVQSQEPFERLENTNHHKDGRLITLETSGVPIFDENGIFQGYRGIDRDITERKKAEQKLKESEEKFRTAVKNNPDFLVFIKTDGTIFDVNRLEKGFTREMVIGQSVFNRNFYETEDQLESARKMIRESLETGETALYEFSLITPHGTQSFYETRVSPFEYDNEDKIISLQIAARNITERKRMIKEIQAHEQELFAIYKYAPIPIILVDEDRRVRKANRLALEFARRSQDEIFGLPGGEAFRCLNFLNAPRRCGFGVECQTCNLRNTILDTLKTGADHYNVEANLSIIQDNERIDLNLLVSTFPVIIRDEKLVLVSLNDITERKKVEHKLKQIEWLLNKKPIKNYKYMPSYGNLVELNTEGAILNLVGKDVLTDIATNYLDLLETSAAVYEKNGDYALGIFSSSWCRFLDTASRNLCETNNNLEALKCGKWLCHESCWNDASKISIKTGKPVDIECHGGIHLYAIPIFVEEEIIGSINFGYGDPPKDPQKLKEIAEKYGVNVNELVEHAKAYQSRPQFIIDLAKKRLDTSAKLLGIMIELKKTQEKIINLAKFPSENPNPVLRVNKESVIYSNKTGQKLFQIKKGSSNPVLIHDKINKAFDTMTSQTTDIEINDNIYTIDITPIKEEGYANIYCRDITKRKKIEEILKEAHSELDQIFNASIPMYVTDTDFNVIRANDTFSSVFQIKREEMIGKKCYEIWDGPYCNTPKCSLCQILDGRDEYEYEIEKEVKLGNKITCISKTVPYLNADRKIIGTIKFFIDITERKEVEELKSQMITRFSHEFKTPLVAIKGNLDLLIKEYGDILNAEILHLLIDAKDGSERLQNLINSFIESSQLRVKLVKLNLETGNLNALISFCLEELKGLIEWRRHTVNLDIEEELIINFDKKKVKEVISNFILNAISYTPSGGKISINSRIEENSLVISIKDNGIGLTERDKTQLFKQFGKIERYGQGWDILEEGSGMGLYISKELIELHGGKVWVESEGKNRGSTFYFSLPLI